MAVDLHELMKKLGYKRINLAVHDIGLMVAYAYAAQFPGDVKKLTLMMPCYRESLKSLADISARLFNDVRNLSNYNFKLMVYY